MMYRIMFVFLLVVSTVTQANETIVMRDPFSEPQTVQQAEGEGTDLLSAFGSGFRRTPDSVQVPQLLFKGYVDRGPAVPPMALIQIAGKRVHMVKEGDEINIDPANPRHAIRITKISRLSITVEAGTLGQMKVLR